MVYEGEPRDPEIYVAENASYYVRGGIELEGEPMNAGANREHYALCRCGQSKNKPFCDGHTGGSSSKTLTISVSSGMKRKAAVTVGVAVVALLCAQTARSACDHGSPKIPQVVPTNGITTLTLTTQEKNGRAAMSYLGALVPPTIRVVPGGQLRITYVNNLALHATEQCALGTCMDNTNLHFHGMEVSPSYGQDDVVTMLAAPGQTLHYDVHVPRDVPPGLYWFHTHPMGESDEQALDGMSGAIVVEGIDRYVPLLRTMPERVIVLRTTPFAPSNPALRPLMRTLDVDGERLPLAEPNAQPALHGERRLSSVDCHCAGRATVLADRQCFGGRLCGYSHRRIVDARRSLRRRAARVARPTASDAQYDHIVMPTAGRVEAIVTGPPAGTDATLRTHCVDTGPAGDPMHGQVLADISPTASARGPHRYERRQVPPHTERSTFQKWSSRHRVSSRLSPKAITSSTSTASCIRIVPRRWQP